MIIYKHKMLIAACPFPIEFSVDTGNGETKNAYDKARTQIKRRYPDLVLCKGKKALLEHERFVVKI